MVVGNACGVGVDAYVVVFVLSVVLLVTVGVFVLSLRAY